MGHAHWKVFRVERRHVPPLRQGNVSQALLTGVSHRVLVKPRGQVHWKEGARPTLPGITVHVPPFWQISALVQGFLYWQNSPVSSGGHLKIKYNDKKQIYEFD